MLFRSRGDRTVDRKVSEFLHRSSGDSSRGARQRDSHNPKFLEQQAASFFPVEIFSHSYREESVQSLQRIPKIPLDGQNHSPSVVQCFDIF